MLDPPPPGAPLAVAVELGARRAFASALDWPGWCRSGRDEAAALEALAAAAPRYAPVAAAAGLTVPAGAPQRFQVVERLEGSATTDFGAPGSPASAEALVLTRDEAERVAALVAAAWRAFDRVASAAPAVLRKGPRGGGRDRDAIVEHVWGADIVYARKLGIRWRASASAAEAAGVRPAVLAAIGGLSAGAPPVGGGWSPRYAARRIAWHALDHAWEIEDRTQAP
ncbi:MAG TPA: hypothetical protein VMW49_00200 [Candidatus Dormibacteraeota bacterium]|nr:hypothetical protein [Candidatus Dormibacteraeota bacterium]